MSWQSQHLTNSTRPSSKACQHSQHSTFPLPSSSVEFGFSNSCCKIGVSPPSKRSLTRAIALTGHPHESSKSFVSGSSPKSRPAPSQNACEPRSRFSSRRCGARVCSPMSVSRFATEDLPAALVLSCYSVLQSGLTSSISTISATAPSTAVSVDFSSALLFSSTSAVVSLFSLSLSSSE